MVRRSSEATPNTTMCNLRESRAESQADVAESLNTLARHAGKNVEVTAHQISRWERGVTKPTHIYRRLLGEHYGVSVDQLGFADLRPEPARMTAATAAFAQVTTQTATEAPVVAASQTQWRATRTLLNARRVPLARAVADLYDDAHYAGTGMLTRPEWLPDQPMPLEWIGVTTATAEAPTFTGAEAVTEHVRPFSAPERRHGRYSQAIRHLNNPRLFENRLSWRLADVSWNDVGGKLAFDQMTYFDLVDTGEAIAHEAAARYLTPAGDIRPVSWRGLGARKQLGDPFDTARRAVALAVDTLTIRLDRDGATFVLHQRDSGNVAVAGGMMHVMPCGIFQPASVHPASLVQDFNLWRNIQREYSEEFLGNPEHDGTGQPVDYDSAPFSDMQAAVDAGRLRTYCLGVGMDALTLAGEALTVAVWDADVYDRLFAHMVDHNDEGTVVKTGSARPTSAIPFTGHMVDELCDGGRLAPAGAGLLRLAWQHRHALLGR